mgnify:CR=1 FL=1
MFNYVIAFIFSLLLVAVNGQASFANNATLKLVDINTDALMSCVDDDSYLNLTIVWLQTSDFINTYDVEPLDGFLALENNSNILRIINVDISREDFYLCGIDFQNGTLKVLKAYKLVAKVTPILLLTANSVLINQTNTISAKVGDSILFYCASVNSRPDVYLYVTLNFDTQNIIATSDPKFPAFATTEVNETFDSSTGLNTNTIKFTLNIDQSYLSVTSILLLPVTKNGSISFTSFVERQMSISDPLSTSTSSS